MAEEVRSPPKMRSRCHQRGTPESLAAASQIWFDTPCLFTIPHFRPHSGPVSRLHWSTTCNIMASPVSLPTEVLIVIASHWDGCIEDAKQTCLASSALCALYQPLLFRVVQINEKFPSISKRRVASLLDAVTSNPSLTRLVRELEWILDPRSPLQTPQVPRLFKELQYLTRFDVKSGGASSVPWKLLSEEHRQIITDLCRRPTLQALSVCHMFKIPPEIIFNPALKIKSLCFKNTCFLLTDRNDPHPFAKYLKSVAYLASLEHIEAAYNYGIRSNPWVKPVVQASASTGSLMVLNLDLCAEWYGCRSCLSFEYAHKLTLCPSRG